MRIEQLQAFLAVADTGSFQQAAQICAVTQSTISRQIQSLEEGLGVTLFHRQGHNKLTLQGDRFYAYAKKICQEWRNATEELAYLMSGQQPELCVAAIPSVCAYQLPPVLQRFCGDFPQVQLRVTTLGSDRALKVLKDGLIDVAIVMQNRFLTNSQAMVVDLLYEESILLLTAAHHPLAQYAIVPWQELAKYPQVIFKDGYGIQRLVQEQFKSQGLFLNAALELNSLDAFRAVVRQGNLAALLPQTALQEAIPDPSLAVRPMCLPVLSRQVVLVTSRDRLEIPPIRHFCKLVREYIQTPLKEYSMELGVSIFEEGTG
jgi:DNA-binding transcriptional LysR family regulator